MTASLIGVLVGDLRAGANPIRLRLASEALIHFDFVLRRLKRLGAELVPVDALP
jgi:hypothetical protein